MKYCWDEMDQLAGLLEAEANGLAVDVDEMRRLAELVAQNCPEIAGSMHRIMRRMDVTLSLAA
jgi:hypothetical protein